MLCKTREVAKAFEFAGEKIELLNTDSVPTYLVVGPMQDVRSSDAARGWPILEAMERTDPDLWKVWTDAKAAFEKAEKPIPSGPGAFITRSANELRKLKQTAQEAFSDVQSVLWDKLRKEQLVAFGSRKSSVEQPTLIYSEGWSRLVLFNWAESILKERGTDGVKIYNVRIYPLIHSPDAATRLAGLGLAQAFKNFVVRDPEVSCLGKSVVAQERRHEAVFREGEFPSWMTEFTWPLDVTAKELAFNFVRPVIFFTGQSLPKASPTVQQVSSVLVDRLYALRRHLVDGKVVARGTFARTGMVGIVDPMQWQRHGTLIDIRNGDLLALENNKQVLLWSGLTLVDPVTSLANQRPTAASSFHVEPAEYVQAPQNTTAGSPSQIETATMASIEEAIQALWPNGIPRGLMKKQRDKQIIDWQKRNRLAVVSTRSIGRYFKDKSS